MRFLKLLGRFNPYSQQKHLKIGSIQNKFLWLSHSNTEWAKNILVPFYNSFLTYLLWITKTSSLIVIPSTLLQLSKHFRFSWRTSNAATKVPEKNNRPSRMTYTHQEFNSKGPLCTIERYTGGQPNETRWMLRWLHWINHI